MVSCLLFAYICGNRALKPVEAWKPKLDYIFIDLSINLSNMDAIFPQYAVMRNKKWAKEKCSFQMMLSTNQRTVNSLKNTIPSNMAPEKQQMKTFRSISYAMYDSGSSII